MATEMLRLPGLKARTGLSRSTIYARIREGDGDFPKPVKLGKRAVGWVASEVDAWLAAQVERSRTNAA
jgi:prophage regulatory protein